MPPAVALKRAEYKAAGRIFTERALDERLMVAVYILYIINCFFLIMVVLLQAGKGDMGAVFGGGGGGSTVLGARGAASFLSKLTVSSAVLFMGMSVILALHSSTPDTVTQERDVNQEDIEAILNAPGLGELGDDDTEDPNLDDLSTPLPDDDGTTPEGTGADSSGSDTTEGSGDGPAADSSGSDTDEGSGEGSGDGPMADSSGSDPDEGSGEGSGDVSAVDEAVQDPPVDGTGSGAPTGDATEGSGETADASDESTDGTGEVPEAADDGAEATDEAETTDEADVAAPADGSGEQADTE